MEREEREELCMIGVSSEAGPHLPVQVRSR